METNTSPVHFAIVVYDDGPPPAAPRVVSLCITGRQQGGRTSEQDDLVTCPACLNYMRELGL